MNSNENGSFLMLLLDSYKWTSFFRNFFLNDIEFMFIC